MATSPTKNSSSDDGKEYVVIKTDSDAVSTPVDPSTESATGETKEEEPSKAPEILYKVQYNDYQGVFVYPDLKSVFIC